MTGGPDTPLSQATGAAVPPRSEVPGGPGTPLEIGAAGWREILLAAALQGAIFAVVQAALDRATAEGTAKLTGEWPGEGADQQSGQQPDGAASKSDHRQ